jgi:hypothetical protein
MDVSLLKSASPSFNIIQIAACNSFRVLEMHAFEQFYYFIGEIGECLGVPMFFSCFDPETTKEMVIKSGFIFL